MLTFDELSDHGEPGKCRYALTDLPPHFFCGAATDGRAYCATHDALCHVGTGKPWQGLAGMIEAMEQTVRKTPRRRADVQPPLDEALRGAVIDKPQGLMERL